MRGGWWSSVAFESPNQEAWKACQHAADQDEVRSKGAFSGLDASRLKASSGAPSSLTFCQHCEPTLICTARLACPAG